MKDIRDLVLDFYEKKAKAGETKVMFPKLYRGLKDLCKKEGIDPPYAKKDVKDVVLDMIQKEELDYWSSGSTTYIKIHDNTSIEELRKGSLEGKVDSD